MADSNKFEVKGTFPFDTTGMQVRIAEPKEADFQFKDFQFKDPVLTIKPDGTFQWHPDAAKLLPKMEFGYPYNYLNFLLPKCWEADSKQAELAADIAYNFGQLKAVITEETWNQMGVQLDIPACFTEWAREMSVVSPCRTESDTVRFVMGKINALWPKEE